MDLLQKFYDKGKAPYILEVCQSCQLVHDIHQIFTTRSGTPLCPRREEDALLSV